MKEARLSVADSEATKSLIAPVRSSSDAMWRVANVARWQNRPSHTDIPTQLATRVAKARIAPKARVEPKAAPKTTPLAVVPRSGSGMRLAAVPTAPGGTLVPSTGTPSLPAVVAPPTPLATLSPLNPPLRSTPTESGAPGSSLSSSTPVVVQLTPPRAPVAEPSVVTPAPSAAKMPVAPPAVPARRPASLSSREADRRLLAQLDADLRRADNNLDRANSRLSEGQRQLSQFESVLQQAMLEAGPDAKGLHPFVRVAERYMGTPYVWGGESARGFDCSGFIIRVMRDLGYKTPPHSAALQFNCGIPIAQALLKPGDLVFFKNTYKPGVSHVGIYLGHRRFIHAAGTGIGTIVSSLDTAKFQAKYAGARRLVPAR